MRVTPAGVTLEVVGGPTQVCGWHHKKIASGPTFLDRDTCENDLPAIIDGFPGTLIYETIIHYINTVP